MNAVLVVLFSSISMTLANYLALITITRTRFRALLCLRAIPFTALIIIARMLSEKSTLLTSMLGLLLMPFIMQGIKGWRCLLLGAGLFISNLLIELLMGIWIFIFPAIRPIFIDVMVDPMHNLISSALSLVNIAIICLGARGAMNVARRIARADRNEASHWAVCLRLGVLAVCVAGAEVLMEYALASSANNIRTSDALYFGIITVMIALMGIAIVYFVRDLKYLSQIKRNETLDRQLQISEALLTSLRFFRHNMLNMLYGVEGAMLSHDFATIEAYYREMTLRCALVNNENVVALQRIRSKPLSALLLREIDRAQRMGVPFYLYTEDGLRAASRMKDSDLVEIVGVLVDNAIEAA